MNNANENLNEVIEDEVFTSLAKERDVLDVEFVTHKDAWRLDDKKLQKGDLSV